MSRSDPNAIALETSGSWLSFAFLRKGKIVEAFHKKVGVRHDEIFWRVFPQYLKRLKLRFEDLDFVAITRGPGRFTGVRLGLAISNLWARFLKIPLFAPTTIDLLRWQFCRKGTNSKESFPLASFLVAFSGVWSGAVLGRKIKGYLDLDDFLEEHKKRSSNSTIFYWAQDAKFQEIQEAMRRNNLTDLAQFVVPKAEDLLKMAIWGQNSQIFTREQVHPLYLKDIWK